MVAIECGHVCTAYTYVVLDIVSRGLHVCVSCMYMCMCVCACVCLCVPAHCSLKAEPSSILRNRELTEYGQTFAVAIIIAGFRSTERASGAASILVLV